jgi:hypothetical protein
LYVCSFYGGGFATIPAYLADIFGTKFVGGIHGRLLTAWSTAGILGPVVLTTLREHSVHSAVTDIASQVRLCVLSPQCLLLPLMLAVAVVVMGVMSSLSMPPQVSDDAFRNAFGAPKTELSKLVETKAVTIARLMEVAPPSVVDPTPFLYDTTMYTMAGMLSIALVSNTLMRPVHPKHHMP